MNKTLEELLKEAAAKVKAMSPEQLDDMMRKQRDGYVRAEMSWPKPKFHYKDDVKVYDSFEDYLND